MRNKCILLVAALIFSLSVPTALAGDPSVDSADDSAPFSAPGARPHDLGVQMTDPPAMSVDRSRLNFGALAGGPHSDPRELTVSNSGGGYLHWLAMATEWVQLDPSSGLGGERLTVSVNPTGLSTGHYSGTIAIADPLASNSPATVDIFLRVMDPDDPPFGSFSTPVDGSTVRGMIPVTGWVLDDVQVSSVKIYRQDEPGLAYIGDAVPVRGARPDVEAAYPDYPSNDRAGWGYMLLTNFLPDAGNGTFMLHAIATDSSGHQVTLGTKTITADNAHAVKPFGDIDTPIQGGTASGHAFVNWGWALTPQPNAIAADGSTINVYVDGVNVGHPVYNVYRADIATLFPGYANSDGAAGYFYLDTTQYENGIHTIQWVARDSAGNTDGIGSRYFAIHNPPSDEGQVYVDDDFDAATPGWNYNRFASVQDGIDGAPEYHTVNVAAGIYTETVALDRKVRLWLSGDVVLGGDLVISTGAFVASGGDLALTGDWTHSGGVFEPGDGMVTFNGNGTQTITGDTVFHHLTVGDGVSLETSANVTVNGMLINNGVTRETKTIAGTGATAFGLADVAVHLAEPGLTSLQVERRDQNHLNAPPGIQTGRYWTFMPTGSGFSLCLTLPHDSIPDANDKVCRYTGVDDIWECGVDSFDSVNSTINRCGITELSDWATGSSVGAHRIRLPLILLRRDPDS